MFFLIEITAWITFHIICLISFFPPPHPGNYCTCLHYNMCYRHTLICYLCSCSQQILPFYLTELCRCLLTHVSISLESLSIDNIMWRGDISISSLRKLYFLITYSLEKHFTMYLSFPSEKKKVRRLCDDNNFPRWLRAYRLSWHYIAEDALRWVNYVIWDQWWPQIVFLNWLTDVATLCIVFFL